MKNSYIIKALERLKANSEAERQMYSLGIDIINYEAKNGLVSMVEESIAVIVSDGDEKVFELVLNDVQWWLYEGVDKIITYSDNNNRDDLNKVEDFVNWLFKHYEK